MSKKPWSILVIDDEKAVLEAVEDILTLEGIQVLTAVDGPTGITLYQNHQDEIDLVLLDLSMPVMNGEETFTALRQINPDVVVVLTSGYHEQDAMRYISQPNIGFLQKPYTWESLINGIHHYLKLIGS
jgi:two-component system, cell cycle sensor histidine kinase and response regulator CckA